MASLRNHKVTETWVSHMDTSHRYHFTKNDRVVRTGTSDGNAKLLHITERGALNFSGMGRRATVADFREKFNDMAGWTKI